MDFNYQKSKLWLRTLAPRTTDDENSVARERLRQAFTSTRGKVIPLVAMIGRELPDLTVHDMTHIDALWGVADTILGDDYDINPAEAFVLGMAFLLHDAATTTFAYQNGVEELKQTVEWRDYVAQNGYEESELERGKPAYQEVLFEVLRVLHPQQAEKLHLNTWADMSGQAITLCESDLNNYYGSKIGELAHSHWWDVAKIEQRLGGVANMTLPAFLHVVQEDWRVDMLKLAFILRCVDAAHIDSRRAPTMLAALTQPKGYSGLHWYFQNQLGCAALSEKGLLYWSAGKPCDKVNADAWWLYFDTAKMIDRELKVAQRILFDYKRIEFAAKGVLGANDLAEFKKHAPVQGWEPVDVNFQVSNVPNIIEKFGGTALYGDNPWLALRELIQNAADATRAARALGILEADEGRIDIEIEERGDEKWLHVTDQGIGMSRYVLTDVLLDFGRSLWSDTAVRREWAGLSASGFKSVGKFGIGFFSVFMLGDEVEVTTWQANKGKNEQLKMLLRDKTLSRPIISQVIEGDCLKKHGTKVSIKLNSESYKLPAFTSHIHNLGASTAPNTMSLGELVGSYAPALDITIKCIERGLSTIIIQANDWRSITNLDLIYRIAPSLKYVKNSGTNMVKDVISPLFNNTGEMVGRLALTLSAFDRFFRPRFGAYVNQGILVEKTETFIGILTSDNNVDLSRKITSIDSKCLKIKDWIELQDNVLSSHQIKSINWMNVALPRGLSLKHHHPIAVVDGKELNSTQFEAWLNNNDNDEIICIEEEPNFQDYIERSDNRDMSENVFNNNVILYPNVVIVGATNASEKHIFPHINSEFQSCLDVVKALVIKNCHYR